MKNRIILKCSAIIFALFLFGCSANVEVEPPRDTALSEVTVNGNLAIPDKEGNVWTYKLYGTDLFYNLESIEAIPSHADATVQFDKDIKQFNKVQVGQVFTLKITVTNGKSVEEHTLNIVYAKELMFSSITVNGSHLAKPSEDGKVWTCNFYGTEPEFEIKSIVATPVENYVYIVDYEKTQGVIKLGETFSTKLTITNEGRVLEYELRVTYNSDLSLSEVTVNGNSATSNEDGSVWNCKIFGTQTPYQISNIVATAKDSSAIVNVAEKTASLNFGEKFTTTITYSNNGNTKEYTLNVVYAKETTVDTVEELKVGDFDIGDIVTTRGYYTVGDNGAAHYEIMTYDYWYENVLPKDVRYINYQNKWSPTPIDEYGNHTLKNGKVAALVGNSYTPEQWGAKGDGETNDVWPFIHMFAQVKTGEIICRSDATYILGLIYDMEDPSTARDNPYKAYLCGALLGGQYFYKPIMANVKNLVIDGNGCLVTQPAGQWGNSGMGMLNFAQDIENLEIKNFRFDGKGRTMFYNIDETKAPKTSNHTIFYSPGQLYLNGMPDGENHYKYGKEYNKLEPNASFKPCYVKNFNIHHNSFYDAGTMWSKAGDWGGDFILFINPTALDGLYIEDNVFENWGRWVFAIDLGGYGERLYNIKFNRNQCLGANREEVNGLDMWKWRALGLIDFETKKCFENVEFIGNTVKGSAGWAINGNSKVNRNFVIKDNYWQHLGGGYPYGFELYSGIGSNIVFEGNELVGVGVKPGYFTHDFTFINNYMTSSVRTAGVAGTIRFENNTSEERGFVRHLWSHVSNNYDDSFITMEKARKDRIKVIFKNNDCFMGAMFNNFAEPEKDMAKYFDFDLDYDVIMKSEVTAFNSNLAIDFQKAKYNSQSLYFNGVKSIGPLVDKNAISAIYFKKGQTAIKSLNAMETVGGKYFNEDLVENFNTYGGFGYNWKAYIEKHGLSNVALECTEDGYLPGACQYGFRTQVTHIKYFIEPDANGNRVKAQDNAYICTDEDLYFTIAGGALDIVPTHKEGTKVYTNSDGTTIELIYIGKLGKFKLVPTPKE